MPRDKADTVPQRKQSVGDRVDQLGMATAWKVGPADTPLEENITHKCNLLCCMKIDNMARGMAGTVVDIQLLASKLDPVPLLQPAVRGNTAPIQAILPAPERDRLQQELVIAVRPDNRNTPIVGQLCSRPGMVEVAMGQQQPDRFHLLPPDMADQHLCITARIDKNSLSALLADQQGAVLLQWGNRDNFELH